MESIKAISALPPKVARPIMRLHELGHINEHDLETLARAYDLTQDHQNLMYFLARIIRAPNTIGPAVKVAQKHQLRISYNWSDRRWRDLLQQYDSNAESSGKNVEYDTRHWDCYLSPAGQNYVIRTRDELIRHGESQHHCIGNYHGKIQRGVCGVLSVPCDGRTWTVAFTPSGDIAQPLKVSGISAKYNRSPSHSTRAKILNEIGVNEELWKYDFKAAAGDWLNVIPIDWHWGGDDYRQNPAMLTLVDWLQECHVAKVKHEYSSQRNTGLDRFAASNPQPVIEGGELKHREVSLKAYRFGVPPDHVSANTEVALEIVLREHMRMIVRSEVNYPIIKPWHDCYCYLELDVAESRCSVTVCTKVKTNKTKKFSYECILKK